MPSSPTKTLRAAVVQAGSIPFDTDACIDKAVRLTAEAAAGGAKLVVFPEAFVPGYPKGLNYGLVVGARDPVGREEFRMCLDAAIEVPGPHTQRLGEAAAAQRCYLVIGVIERELGTCYCTVLFFGPDGALAGKHHKLSPTAMERAVRKASTAFGSTINGGSASSGPISLRGRSTSRLLITTGRSDIWNAAQSIRASTLRSSSPRSR